MLVSVLTLIVPGLLFMVGFLADMIGNKMAPACLFFEVLGPIYT
ncbi:hypothetical protein [Maridesulfovibrio sp.]|nr:hypothetical protein [Maridesulfovibrio sp.]